MADCSEQNPVTPVFSRARPVSNENCIGSCGDPNGDEAIYTPPEVPQKDVIILPGFRINVTDLSDSATWKYLIDYAPYTALSVALTLQAYEGVTLKTNPVLDGTVIDRVFLQWAYNKSVASQQLTNNGGILPPTLVPSDTEYDYTGQTIESAIAFTIQGNDGAGESGSVANDTKSITFGNYRTWGVGDRSDLYTAATFKTFLEDLIANSGTKELTTVRLKNALDGEGDPGEYMYYLYPKSWGYARFFQYNNEGGWVRVYKDSNGDLQTVSPGVESEQVGEQEILVSNGLVERAMRVYRSLNDNQGANVEPFEIR